MTFLEEVSDAVHVGGHPVDRMVVGCGGNLHHWCVRSRSAGHRHRAVSGGPAQRTTHCCLTHAGGRTFLPPVFPALLTQMEAFAATGTAPSCCSSSMTSNTSHVSRTFPSFR